MSSEEDFSDSDSKVIKDENEEEQIYQLIYDMNTTDDKEGIEKVQIPSSSGHTPVHLKADAESGTHADVGNTKGVAMDGLDNIHGIPVLKVTAEAKPWRKAGADISDYFNYGFDEESWNTYCKKQAKFSAANRKLNTEIMIQKGHTPPEEKESCSAYPSSGCPSIRASRQSTATTDLIRRQPGSSRVEGRDAQVVTEMERKSPYRLFSPSSVNSFFAFSPPPRPPPRSALATLDSFSLRRSKGFDDSSTLSGVSSLIPKSKTCSTGVMDTARVWGNVIWQEKCTKDRGRSREHGHDRASKRYRDRDRESRPASLNRFVYKAQDSLEGQLREVGRGDSWDAEEAQNPIWEEEVRLRDATGRRHSFERLSGDRDGLRQRRHRDKSQGWQKSSCSSSRRDAGEDRDSQSRHKHKKAKRNRKDKETKKTV